MMRPNPKPFPCLETHEASSSFPFYPVWTTDHKLALYLPPISSLLNHFTQRILGLFVDLTCLISMHG
jgi:hypothetical protein